MPVDIPVNVVEMILRDLTKRTRIELSGGEFLLHPHYEEILQMVSDRKYTLLSNGILADKLIKTVREYAVKDIAISCDGARETYLRVRGVDNFANIAKIVNELKDETHLSLKYCINPLNAREDLRAIKEFCDVHGLCLTVGIYNAREFFETTMGQERIHSVDGILSGSFTNKYLRLYNSWLVGELKLPCYSIRKQCTIFPDGSVSMCEGKVVLLGNIEERPLSEIWNADETIKLQKQITTCNGCWLICHRPVDVGIAMIMKRVVPRFVLNGYVGKYDWDKI